ncbi:hypothetical protein [Enterococcus larvae]|uniref:hypothetical protein n=1 Tax=Enterococcus larvae TaxID=2794352 RepID=UPI003F386466
MNDIITQLQQHCLCFCDEDEGIEQALERALVLFSLFTCGNSIGVVRKQERIKVEKNCICSCSENYISFFSFYPYPQNYEVSIETISGISRESQSAEFLEIVEGEIKIDISSIPCNDCSCDDNFVVIDYDAYPELIPDDLLPFFCDLMNLILTFQDKACGNCTNCTNFQKSDIYAEIEEDRANMIDLQEYIYGYYKQVLRKYSLCKRLTVFGVRASVPADE